MKIHDESQIYDDTVPGGGMMFDLSAEDDGNDGNDGNDGSQTWGYGDGEMEGAYGSVKTFEQTETEGLTRRASGTYHHKDTELGGDGDGDVDAYLAGQSSTNDKST